MENNNRKDTYVLSDIIKEIRLTRKNVPQTKTILTWLKGTEFDINNDISLKSCYDYKTYKSCKKFIEEAIKTKISQSKSKNKLERIYFYISVGGTPELNDKFKIEISDHLITRITSPKGCDRYCTENQIGKPQNWIKLPAILMPDGSYIDSIKKLLSEKYGQSITKVSNDIYQVVDSSGMFMNVIKNIRESIFSSLDNKWFSFNYDTN